MTPETRIVAATFAFAALHSGLASVAVKEAAARRLGEARRRATYRLLYVAQALPTAAALMLYVRRQRTATVFRARGPVALAMRTGQAAALLGVAATAFAGGIGRLNGIDGLGAWARGEPVPIDPAAQGPERDTATGELVVAGGYRLSRHPLNAFAIPVLWLTPRMTRGRLAFNLAATAYLVAGSVHEASRLRRAYGDAYAAYERSGVPFLVPRPGPLVAAAAGALRRLPGAARAAARLLAASMEDAPRAGRGAGSGERGAPAAPAVRRGPRRRLPARGRAEGLEVDDVPVSVSGSGRQAVLMIHGWPDTAALWDGLVGALSDRMRCVRFTLPGYLPGRGHAPQPLEETLALVGRIADAVSPDRPVDLVVHDWGCVFGYLFALERPERVRRIVGVDVGDAGSPEHLRSLGLVDKAAVVAYQLLLAGAWTVGGPLGDAVSRGFAGLIGAPTPRATVGARMGWPYAMAWTGRYRRWAQAMRDFEPPRPMLYVWGSRKPFMFHSPEWVAALRASGVHRAEGLLAGHWPMRDRAARFERLVGEWLDG